ncbi:hypothetical protein LENED_005801 [Lentinula edodes]|uniref:Uncharacterized protein n=1 Tax=Lentinula edodes TaxID=5353 RepID=A0A1Q3E9Z9_LENED|nr:hypothetical protein LENED_005801 [Lentinula edodes]
MELTLQLMPSPSHSFLPSEAIKDISVNSSSTTNLLPVKAFIALQLSGGMGMLLLLVTALASRTHPPLTGATTFALLLDVWLMFRTAALGKWFGGRKVTNSLLLAPYILWVILTIGFLIAGGVEPHLVQRDLAIDPYCILDNPVPPILVCSLTLAFALAVMVVLIVLVVTMRKQATRSSSHPSSAFIPSQSEHDGDYHKGKSPCSRKKEQMSALIVRLIVFGLAGLIAVTISVVFVLNRAAGSGADLALATLPPIGVVIFGSQTDFVQLWFNLIRWLFRCSRNMEYSLPLVRGLNPSFLASEVTIDVLIDNSTALDILTSKIFIALQFSGGIGMLLLLVTALVSRTQFFRLSTNNCTGNGPIKRSRTWYSFCISWMISSFSYCLLFFAMKQFNPNQKPSYGLCLTQAALVYSSPPLTGATTFSLLLEVWLMFRFAASGKRSVGSKVMVSLLIAPYVLWVLLTVGFLILGGVNPSLVQRDLASAPYCVLNNPAPPILVSSLTLIFALGVMIMLCNLVISMHRTRTSVTHDFARHPRTFMLRASQSREGKSTNNRNNLKEQISPLIIRLIVFSIGGLIAIIVSIVFWDPNGYPAIMDQPSSMDFLAMRSLYPHTEAKVSEWQ